MEKSGVNLADRSLAQLKDAPLSRIKVRKPSYGFSSVPGIKPIDRTSQIGMDFKRPILIYLPTFQLEPRLKIDLDELKDLINDVLDHMWDGHRYSTADSPVLALKLSTEVMRRARYVLDGRYRILAVVSIAQRRAQSYNNAISFIWDTLRDTYVEVHREESTAFIQVTLFAVYLD